MFGGGLQQRFHLSPFTGRGRERSERVRGEFRVALPLTPTLSPQAGRGSA